MATTQPKTKFAGKVNIFTGKDRKISLDKISVITEDPPEKRSIRSKFESTFATIKPGQAMVYESEGVMALASAFRKYLERNKRPYLGCIRTLTEHKSTPGMGRVYYVKGEQK